MAKERQQHSIANAIAKVTAALRLESIPNPTKEQKQQIHDAKVAAADCIDNSNFVTLAEHGDDNIETTHQVDEILEQAGIDPVDFRRQGAIAGANMAVEIEQARQPENPEQVEEIEEPEQSVIGAPAIDEKPKDEIPF